MSDHRHQKVSAYVMGSDGLLYQDPIVKGKAPFDWYICFWDDEPPEIVMALPGGLQKTRSELVDTVNALLVRVGIDAVVTDGPFRSPRLFDGVYHPASSFHLNLREPLPVELMRLDAKGLRQPVGECVIYSCGRLWG